MQCKILLFIDCMFKISKKALKTRDRYFGNMVKELMRLGYRRRESIFGAPYDFRKAPSENSMFTGLHFSSAFGISSLLRTKFLQFIFVNASASI